MPLQTPGVYIEEKNAFPNTVVPVATAIPVFIGYTEKATFNGKSLLYKPVRINSLSEYIQIFGHGIQPVFKQVAGSGTSAANSFTVNGFTLQQDENTRLYFYNAIRFFYANGGGECYILSIGIYGNNPAHTINTADFTGTTTTPTVFKILEKEPEPTIIVMPDIIAKGIEAYPVYQLALQHCATMQNRVAVFDIAQTSPENLKSDLQTFRQSMGNNYLKYGIAYAPFLNATIASIAEINFTNLDAAIDLENLLPEPPAKKIAAGIKAATLEQLQQNKLHLHQSLLACSPVYKKLIEEMLFVYNQLPPSGAIAGIFTASDNARGVWKAPANVPISAAIAPTIEITTQQQESMNIDAVDGKSINAIRSFPGAGTLVWGARTLDGNSMDWKYVNVVRTLIMIEQSLKLAMQAYIFEPNNNNTWVTLKASVENFLVSLWKQGALCGNKPDEAFSVDIGAGITMTADDIAENRMRITIKTAIIRPAEFIVLTLQQKQQTQ
ncbi:MAG: phage tail sheath C-terminal domain-containing protein [Flavihumibacter sp.]|nr:phage tail sheath C-terminal domain-containing protein [Flavihumibacter sp.]